MKQGIVILGGGYRYFANAWVAAGLLKHLGSTLPLEVWMHESEYSPRIQKLADKNSLNIRVITKLSGPKPNVRGSRGRWQWGLKLEAILQCDYEQLIFMDADNFAARSPDYLLKTPEFKDTGAIFWPDIQETEKDRPIWDIMGVPWRLEPEFETGQIVLDREKCGEPLELALWMNQRADFFYEIIWGDKDTFRFAWHKFGRRYSMIPHPVQMLVKPGKSSGGVMCQHDFDGNRVFQHRNIAKWELLSPNVRMPGFLHEQECRDMLKELRGMWDGRVRRTTPTKKDMAPAAWEARAAIIKRIVNERWLMEDRRSSSSCCGPDTPWSEDRTPKTWGKRKGLPGGLRRTPVFWGVQTGFPDDFDTNAELQPQNWRGSSYRDMKFASDFTVEKGSTSGMHWWDVVQDGDGWILSLETEAESALKLRETSPGIWEGNFQRLGKKGEVEKARLLSLATAYPGVYPEVRKPVRGGKEMPLVVANHAYGIGDAITGVYACLGAAEAGRKVVYHTRFKSWLARVSHPNLVITEDAPAAGTPNMDADYHEQLRFAADKARWYGQFLAAAAAKQDAEVAGNARQVRHPGLTVSGRPFTSTPYAPRRPRFLDRSVQMQRVEFSRYIVIAPFAAWKIRDWPSANWKRLSWLLTEAGYECVAIGTSREEVRMIELYSQSETYWAVDHSPEWVIDVMLGAAAVIGPDSGMIHVAGLLGVPAICLHAHLPPEFLFSCAPSVRSVAPDASCTFCRWQWSHGFVSGCKEGCSALGSVSPERVMTELSLLLKDGKEAI